MTDPTERGFRKPLDSSPIDIENWDGGAVEETPNDRWHRVWRKEVGDKEYVVHYFQDFRMILFEEWKDGKLQGIPAELSFDEFDGESDVFLQTVELFFKMVGPATE